MPDIEPTSELGLSSQNHSPVTSISIESKSQNCQVSSYASSEDSCLSESKPNSGEFTVSWRNLDYVVNSKWYKFSETRKPILNALNGTFKSGQLSAILGPSGAGKSSLIDCLLGKKPHSSVSGKVKVSFESASLEVERRKRRPLKIALIPQDDHLLESFTVAETFMFASRIKNAHLNYDPIGDKPNDGGQTKPNRKPFDHHANVQRVLQQLNLTSCAGQKCSKLSGGQYKRVSIGQELLSRPDILILDEPTSGLDSVTCYQTVRALRELIEDAPYPLAIVATIHQPDIEVFRLFHKAYVLASGGRAIYEGSTGDILGSLKRGVELVESRRKQPIWALTYNSSSSSSSSAKSKSKSKSGQSQLSELKHQLDDKWCNPAKLIVEVAANEYGYEIVGAMSDLLASQYAESGDKFTTSAEILLAQNLGSTGMNASKHSLATESSLISAPPFDYDSNEPSKRRPELDELLNLNSANMNQRRPLWIHLKHIAYHTSRSWKSILRDPMLFGIMLALHILVPLLISYSFYATRKDDACPKVGPLDVVEEAYRAGSLLDELNSELRSVFENLGYLFFQIYVIIFAAVCVTSLTYPMVMHVLLKEYRNGWYSMLSYFVGRTLADLPVPTLNVIIAMAISYHLTGQPMSPYLWRFVSVASLTVLATLVAQTQGLMFGAMLMNAPQSAVFVAPASTAPLVVVSGFLLRLSSMPRILQLVSKLSYFTYLLDGLIISRYGFGRCPCNETMFNANVPAIPAQSKAIIDLWLESYAPEYGYSNGSLIEDYQNAPRVDLIGKLVNTVTLAKTFGYKIDNCSQVKPFAMLDYDLADSDLNTCFVALALMLVFFRWLTFVVLKWKINTSI